VFTRRHGVNLPRAVWLKVPCSSRLWKVDVTRDDKGELFFENGWRDFTTHYSIDFGYWVQFQYDREALVFNVNVFDRECVEIIYPAGKSILIFQTSI
jgi:hypothetical protein